MIASQVMPFGDMNVMGQWVRFLAYLLDLSWALLTPSVIRVLARPPYISLSVLEVKLQQIVYRAKPRSDPKTDVSFCMIRSRPSLGVLLWNVCSMQGCIIVASCVAL